MSKNITAYNLPIALFAFITLAGVGFGIFGNYSWANWLRATCYPNCFCEAARGGAIEQLSNTYSNLAYVLIGLLIVWGNKGTGEKNLMISSSAYPITYGVTVIAIGAGSFFYHGSLTEVGRWFDWFGMYLYASFIILYNASRLRKLSGAQFVVVYVIFNIILAVVIFNTAPSIRQQIFGLLIAVTLILEYFVRRRDKPQVASKFLYLALGCLVAAYTIWILDRDRILCAPTSLIQGHAAWHILTAMGAGLLFVYYRSEIKH